MLQLAKQCGFFNQLKQRLNLVADQMTAQFVEEQGIPAVYPSSTEPVKMLEFMLRLRRLGLHYIHVAITHGKKYRLLLELEVPVKERVLFRMEGPSDEELI